MGVEDKVAWFDSTWQGRASHRKVGYFDGGANAKRYFTGVANKYSMTGNEFDALDDTDFNIVVDLPSDGLIVNLVGNENDATSAGAIACLYNSAGDYLAIRTNISGKIITGATGTGYSHTGGAIGKEFGKAGGGKKCKYPFLFGRIIFGKPR